jgi:2-dehydropantoate 2-reductase
MILNNICVIGLGGVGGYFGGKIALKYPLLNVNSNISFIARGEHGKAIVNQGLKVVSSDGEWVCRPTLVTDDFSQIPSPDVVLLSIKSYDLDSVVTKLQSIIHNNTVIIPLLNGVDIYERIRKKITKGIVLPSCTYIVSSIEQNGMVVQKGPEGAIVSGPDPNYPGKYKDEITTLMQQCNIKFKWVDNPKPAIWEKFVLIASFALVTANSGKPFDGVLADLGLRNDVIAIMNEIVTLAKAQKITLPENIIESALTRASNVSPGSTTSFQRDVATKGIINEGDVLGESIIALGIKNHVETPVTKRVFIEIERKLVNRNN